MKLHGSENGIVVMLLAITLPVLLVLAALVTFPSYIRLSHAELQSAADAAAHAGAVTMCSTPDCFNQTRAKAIEMLSRYPIHGSSSSEPIAGLDPNGGPIWSTDDYEVTVLRGSWWPTPVADDSAYVTLPDEKRFILLESPDGVTFPPDTLAANLAGFVAVNAIYVKITLKNYNDPFRFASASNQEISAEAIAVGGNSEGVQIEPFAVPLCALVDPDGSYSPGTICNRDYFFARRDRYCTADNPNCNATPGTFAQLTNDFSGMMALHQCSFFHAPVAADVFGMVGTPGITAIESEVVGQIETGFHSFIGDTFHVLENGFTSMEAFNALTNKMTSSEPALGSGWIGAMRWGNEDWGSALGYPDWEYYPNYPEMPVFDCTVPENRGWGACNSIVFQPYEDNWSPNAGIPDACKGPIMGAPSNSIFPYHPYWPNGYQGYDTAMPSYWKTRAAVVVWEGMGACQGAGANTDPAPPPAGADLRVVGFVDIQLYDLDIGAVPPQGPDTVFKKGSDYWPVWDWCDSIEECRNGEEICWPAEEWPPSDYVYCDSTHQEPVCNYEYVCHDVEQCTGDPPDQTCTTESVCGEEEVCTDKDFCCGTELICESVPSPWCSSVNPHSCINPDGSNKATIAHDPWGFRPPVAAGDSNFHCDLVRGRVSCGNEMIPSKISHPTREALLVK